MPESRFRCPAGHPSGVAARVAWGPDADDADWDVLESCPACAQEFFAELWTRRALASAIEPRVASEREPRGRRLWRTARARPLAAAAIVLVASALATGAVSRAWRMLGVSVVGTEAGAGPTALEAARRPRLDYEAAGVAANARVHSTAAFLLKNGQVGTLALLRSGIDAGADLVAFNGYGEPIWRASSRWTDFGSVMGTDRVGALALRVIVTRKELDGVLEETACVVLLHEGRSAALFVDPISGELKGNVFIDGRFIVDGDSDGIAPLPAKDGETRRVCLAAQLGLEPETRAGLVVCDLDGEVVQLLEFPDIQYARGNGKFVHGTDADWTAGSETVRVLTAQGLHFGFPVRNRRLDLTGLRAGVTDNLPQRFDEEKGAGSWELLVESHGGPSAFLSWLGGQVRELPGTTLPLGWRPR